MSRLYNKQYDVDANLVLIEKVFNKKSVAKSKFKENPSRTFAQTLRPSVLFARLEFRDLRSRICDKNSVQPPRKNRENRVNYAQIFLGRSSLVAAQN